MSDPFYGEIRMFAGTFAPRNWAFCAGALLLISQNNALFSLLGTTYGGDGRTSFALPDLRGRIPIHQGTGIGLTPRIMGQKMGSERITLTTNQIPAHTHGLMVSKSDANSTVLTGRVMASHSDGDLTYTEYNQDRAETMSSETVALAGGNESHYNVMPFQCLSFIICTIGDYPSRN